MGAELPVTIYALVDQAGLVHYIGQTWYLRERRRAHRRVHPTLTLIVVTRTDDAHADEVERHWIEHYRARGQASLNALRYVPGRHGLVAGGRHQVLLNLQPELFATLKAEAQKRTLPVATAARQLVLEQLDALAARAAAQERAP